MPHSSGGGSHSGGSHSGGSSHSSHSSRSSGGGSSYSSRRTSNQPFRGAKRYLYYSNNKPYFIYANYDIRKNDISSMVTNLIVYTLFFLPIIIGVFWAMITAVHIPKKLDYFDKKGKNPEFVIEDNLGIFEDEKGLKKSMKAFYEETGIVPAVITVSNDTWNEDYKDLEKFAYNTYVERFNDEVHWLIVYSSAEKDNGFDDWYWEGMQGDLTDPILTSERAGKFTVSLHERFLQRDKYSVDEAIAATFDEYRPHMMNMYVDTAMFVVMLFLFLSMSGLSFLYLFTLCKPRKAPDIYRNAKVCELTAVYQEPCGFCGGIFIIGMHTECPHCGAAIPAHHYMKDAQGNVVQIM